MTDLPSGITTLEDNVKCTSSRVIKYILEKITHNPILVFSIEKTPNKWKSFFGDNYHYIYFDDPQDWKNVSLTNDITKENTTVIIDSINLLSTLIGWEESLLLLNELKKNRLIKNIFIILHNDCLTYGNTMLKHLSYISQTYIVVNNSQSIGKYYLNINLKTPGGKIKKYDEEVYYDISGNKWISKEIQKSKIKVTTQDKVSLPEELTSFKISVEETARAVKDGMVLPYTEVNKKESKIIYHHDAADDWDDEDPDDDLDI